MRKIVMAVGVILLVGARASAARPSSRASATAPESFNWSGCHAGVDLDGAAGLASGGRSTIAAGNTTLDSGVGVPGDLSVVSGGAMVGAQAGCDQQVGRWVYGGETDLHFGGFRGAASIDSPSIAGSDPTTATGGDWVHWYGTLRARAGYAPTERLLVYGTAGLAYGGVTSSSALVLTPVGDGDYAGSTSQTKLGWTLGLGGEYAFDKTWSARLEYLFVDLGSTVVSMRDPNRPGTFIDYAFAHQENVFRLGLNRRF